MRLSYHQRLAVPIALRLNASGALRGNVRVRAHTPASVLKRRKKMKKWLFRGLGMLLKLVVPALVEHLIVIAFAL
jgi:hypothetical protein